MAATVTGVKAPMTTGPNGEKRPRDPAACAHHVFKIATGELPNDSPKKAPPRRSERPKVRASA